jgi:thioesterase domain-containing protein
MTRPELEEAFVAPRDEIERMLTRIWEEVLEIESVGVRDDFFELGGNSLLAMRMFTQIQKMLGKNLPASMLLQASNIEQLADVLRRTDSQKSCLLVTLQSGDPDGIPVFFPHGCGCEVLVYRDLARHLGQEQPFYAIRAQGMYGEKPPRDRIEDMASHYIREIQTIQPDGPYLIGGGGDGGWVAFEMAQQLRARGYEVPLLIIMDAFYRTQYPPPTQVNPSASGSPSPRPSSSTPAGSRKSLFHYIRRSFHHLIRGQLIPILRDNLKVIFEKYYWGFAYGSIPRRIRFIQRRIGYVERVKRLMSRASFRYRPRVYPGRIVYFLSERRREHFSQHWHEIAAGGLDCTVIPGRHSEIWKEPNVQIMAEKLRDLLDEAQMNTHQSER